MDLFDHVRQERLEQGAPLAARMRPRTLDEFVGQEAIVGPGRLLRRAIQADRISSLIFYGPPGTGKTTLARVIANTTAAHFTALNAVLAGVKDLRAAVHEAQERLGLHDQRTILFVDEVHRFNKAQQDALLPWVENGTVIFIGATTENPYFEVNKALVSRSRIFQLKPLIQDHLYEIARRTLAEPERGYGDRHVKLDQEALDHLVDVANGDARALLNALELAVETTSPSGRPPVVHITLPIAEESIQRRAVLYDKEGDVHFDTISAFIKSLRGSDPDAALYWLAKMIYAGEDPHFIFRRMLIFASEDVGMADPQAIQVVTACAESFDRVGMPEGQFPLAQAVLYLSAAEKSNTSLAFFDALDAVQNEPEEEVPNHLKDANRDKDGFGHGAGYLYPHAYRQHWVAQQYLPTGLQGKVFYQPSNQGYEERIRAQVQRRRDAQLAAMVEESGAPPEILTFSPSDPARDRWLRRTSSGAGSKMAAVRDRLLASGPLARHSVLLDLNAGSGLLTWEALRLLPEGGVYSLAYNLTDAQGLRQQAENLPEPERPIVLVGDVATAEPGLLFDAIVGRNALMALADKKQAMTYLQQWLAPAGWMALAERIPSCTQRIYALLDHEALMAGEQPALRADLWTRWKEAEEAIYADPSDPLVNWSGKQLQQMAQAVFGAEEKTDRVKVHVDGDMEEITITAEVLERWFPSNRNGDSGDRPSYRRRLEEYLSPQEVEQVYELLRRRLLGQTVPWHSRTAILTVSAPPSSG